MNGGVGEMIDDVPRWCKPAQNATSPSSVPSLITIVFDLVPGLESVSTCSGLPRAHSRRHGRLRLAASRPVDPNTLGAAVAVCHHLLTAVPISLLSRSHPPASRTGRDPGSCPTGLALIRGFPFHSPPVAGVAVAAWRFGFACGFL